MRFWLCLCLLALGGCDGGGSDPSTNVISAAGLQCPLLTRLVNGRCVSLLDDPAEMPRDNSLVRPQLRAQEPVLQTVTLDWDPPPESWQGLPPLFVSGSLIALSEWQSNVGVFQVIERITLDNPDLLTYVLDLPGPGRWGITVRAISITGSESPASNIEIVNL